MNWFAVTGILTLLFASPADGQSSQLPAKLQPVQAVSDLTGSSGQRFDFIVTGSDAGLKASTSLVPPNVGNPHPLPFISGIGITLSLGEATALAKRKDINQVWYLASSLYPTYCRIIDGLEHAVKTLPSSSVLNMSLGPPADVMPIAGNDNEPMNIATKRAADAGFIIVMAIGNYGSGEDDGIVNPWCRPDWIICVGAASSDAKKVWAGSARGLDTDPRTWPDVVANGIDVISLWPTGMTKSDDRKSYDESNLLFQKTVPKEKWALYTIDSGTSESTPQVTRAAALIVGFVRYLASSKTNLKPGDALFTIEVPQDRLSATSKRGPRLTGDLGTKTDANAIPITYRLVEPWKLVKQILIDSAVPMPDFPPAVVGAGFVDPNYIEKQFATPNKTNILIDSIKVLP